MTFEVNFLYILRAYAAGNDVSNARAALRSRFRKGFMETLDGLFDIHPLGNADEESIIRNFRELNGKVFYDDASGQFLKANPKPMSEAL